MRKNITIMFSASVIFLSLILSCPAAAQTLSVPQTTTTQPKTTSPTLIQQPPTVLRPQVGNALISVLDNHGQPVSAASIILTGNGQSVTQLTNAQGQASFGSLGVGQYSYTARKDGYCSQSANIPLSISMGVTTASKSVLPKYGGAKVIVTYNGYPVPGADVTARSTSGASSSFLLSAPKTDLNGSTTFGILPPAIILFMTSKAGYENTHANVNVPCGQEMHVPVAIKDLPILQPGITRVMVKDLSLGALPGANVRVTVEGIPLSQTTNASGYTDFRMPKGKYVFSASKDGYMANKVDADAATPDWSTYVYITLNKR